MKKLIIVKLIIAVLLLIAIVMLLIVFQPVSCAEDTEIQGKMYQSYGIINENEAKNDSIEYKASVGNMIVGFLLVETVVVPIYVFGYDLFEPVGKK